MAGTVAFVLKGYPRLSETFIAQEIEALEKRGLDIHIYSLRHPTDTKRHPVHGRIKAPVTYLPEYLGDGTGRVARAWLSGRGQAGYGAAKRLFTADLLRDRSRNRIRRFGQALVLANELAPGTTHIHAHFLHTPASVARYAAKLRGLPWSVSAHAKDIWTSPDWEKRAKLADCTWAVTCTKAGCDHLQALSPHDNVSLVYHGLDLTGFPPARRTPGRRDGSDPAAPIRLLSVGRAVEKKGYPDLLAALAMLPSGLAWQLTHIGGGPLLPALKSEARRHGLEALIDWRGPEDQKAVLEAYRAADLFVLASREAADGDRDGLPNVLMEAQSQGLAVVATDISGVPELIENAVNGRLVAPAAPEGMAGALAELIADPDMRQRMGENGAARMRASFSLETCIAPLAERFGLSRADAA